MHVTSIDPYAIMLKTIWRKIVVIQQMTMAVNSKKNSSLKTYLNGRKVRKSIETTVDRTTNLQ